MPGSWVFSTFDSYSMMVMLMYFFCQNSSLLLISGSFHFCEKSMNLNSLIGVRNVILVGLLHLLAVWDPSHKFRDLENKPQFFCSSFRY